MNEDLKSDFFLLVLGAIFVYFGIQGVKRNKKNKEDSIMFFGFRSNLGSIVLGVVFIILGLFKILIDL
jgi:hypothetical protein